VVSVTADPGFTGYYLFRIVGKARRSTTSLIDLEMPSSLTCVTLDLLAGRHRKVMTIEMARVEPAVLCGLTFTPLPTGYASLKVIPRDEFLLEKNTGGVWSVELGATSLRGGLELEMLALTRFIPEGRKGSHSSEVGTTLLRRQVCFLHLFYWLVLPCVCPCIDCMGVIRVTL
jgi:hypothetical protein